MHVRGLARSGDGGLELGTAPLDTAAPDKRPNLLAGAASRGRLAATPRRIAATYRALRQLMKNWYYYYYSDLLAPVDMGLIYSVGVLTCTPELWM
jgi:hypothetical protein